MTILGETVETKLTQLMKSISYLGYMVQSVSSEFGPVEIAGQ